MVTLRRKEIYRYLGFRNTQPPEDIVQRVETCVEEMERAAVFRTIHKRFPVTITAPNTVETAGLTIYSKHLYKNLSGCDYVYLFAATVGIGIDRLCMLMIGKENIQEIMLFPQMKPEAKMPQSSIKEWAELGVPEEWVYVLRKAGFNLISDIRDQKAQGLQQKLGEIVKKYKLDYEKPTVEQFQQWIDKAAATSDSAD